MITLLIASKNVKDLNILSSILNTEKCGIECEFLYANSLKRAVKLSKEKTPTISFIDLNLDDCSIDEVLNGISEFNAPVIILSDYPSNTTREGKTVNLLLESMCAGAKEFIEKKSKRIKEAREIMFMQLLRNYSNKIAI